MQTQIVGTDTRASMEWRNRPDDQRFLSLDELKSSVLRRKQESWTAISPASQLNVIPGEDGNLVIEMHDPTINEQRLLSPTNWAFGQLAQYAKAPAGYLRELPPEIAAINLNWRLEHDAIRDNALILGQSNGENHLRAMTSVGYGRIWDSEVVEMVERINPDQRWVIPSASYASTNPLRATTLYASDRDVFIFLVDPLNPVEVGGETLFRGFFTWNSEVRAGVFGLTTFLYRTICDNRIVWGQTEVRELRIRHTLGAPARFAYEGAKYLERYAQESTLKLVDGIKAAQGAKIPLNTGKDETVADWLAKRGFGKAQAKSVVESSFAEMGKAETVWDVVNGVTAYARSVQNTNDRVELESKAGELMDMVAA